MQHSHRSPNSTNWEKKRCDTIALPPFMVVKRGYYTNGIKLSSNTLLYQSVTGYSTRLHEERVRLGTALNGARLDPVRSVGVDPICVKLRRAGYGSL